MSDSLSIVRQYELSKKALADKRLPLTPVSLVVYLPRTETTCDTELSELTLALLEIPDQNLSDYTLMLKNRIISDIQTLNSELLNANEKASSVNDALDLEESRLNEQLIEDLKDSIESTFDRLVRINTSKLDPAVSDLLLVVYKELGLNHYIRDEHKDIIYFNSEVNPSIVSLITKTYNSHSKTKLPTNYIQTDSSMIGYVSDLVKVVKSSQH